RGVYVGVGETAEFVAKRYKIGREVQDEYALASQQRTARAQAEGYLAEEITPLKVTRAVIDKKTGEVGGREGVLCARDKCNGADRPLEALGALKPYFDPT